ncbi:MAG: right-handed parallel beta-helix repeat-containing protein [Bacteroidales bacterium]|nr:right-handed parallel beta-helix repeat-containing protein [Bacteroidales bacterium]
MKKLTLILIFLSIGLTISAKEYHVSKYGNDKNNGSVESPFLTIQAAANISRPGDIIIVHEGVYREWIIPPLGGNSDTERIVYTSAEGEKVEIKGSEIINEWERFKGTVWKAKISNSFFGDYNPYKDIISGDWFNDNNRVHHTGEVYLNGKSLWEKPILEEVLNPVAEMDNFDPEGSKYTWYCESDDEYTYIYANFHDADPNNELVEINVRKSCFYPVKTGINYIIVRGFHMEQAATQWAPPTAEQPGLIGTNWGKGWIIENNIIRNSKCSGITLGKHGDEYDNTSENSAEGYVETIKRALTRGWSKENIGSHIIRNNTISECGQTGICGSMGAVFSTIENNNIFNIWTKRQWGGAEMGGIKIHSSIDMRILNNRLVNCHRGLWLDWMAQGTIVTGNLLYDNSSDDLFVEVNHGPFLIENNILLSEVSIRDWSEGGAFVHNLIAGKIELRPQSRETPFQLPHSTEIGGLRKTLGGDNRYYNNIFTCNGETNQRGEPGMAAYKNTKLPMFVDGNVYLNKAEAYHNEPNSLKLDYDPGLEIKDQEDEVFLFLNVDEEILKMNNQLVSTDLLGTAKIPDQAYTYPDGTDIKIDRDFFGYERSKRNPVPGPFEKLKPGMNTLKLWPGKVAM